ncbi:MAG: aminotransferase class V-fold PLP-dependent enzyme [Verrucomicrobia bacterium]|nr:aminotransferase class V-fold PLP-dependent enzyme [Verrucomicrobiota bacterium]
MTIQEILSNEELRRHEFPVVAKKTYLAHAGICPLPRRIAEAIKNYTDACLLDDQEAVMPERLLQDTRAAAAQLLDAKPEEIALIGPTSLALSFIAGGAKLRRGENVVVYFDDYPSNVYPWMALADRGVEVRFLNIRELGKIRTIDVIGQIDESTKLVALASSHFLSSYRIDTGAIGKALHDRGILFCVDAIQTLGAFPTSVKHIDFLAADAHKWLLGPCAGGVMYVRKEAQERLRPTTQGWHNLRCPNYSAEEDLVYRDDARRYEAGTANVLGIVGLKASLELILELGIDAIGQELWRKRSWLVPALQKKGYTVLNADALQPNTGGSITFSKPDVDMAILHAQLQAADIVASLRPDRTGKQYLRFSPHFYNTDEELHRTLELL